MNLACKDSDAIYLNVEEERDFRTPFFRDIDRILYSLSFQRYMDKTQVFSFKDNDHLTKRMIHVLYVSKIARTIGRELGLNEDLIEAGALGHDLGHTPFGHVGEAILNEISVNAGCGYFNHNVHSVRLLMSIENHGRGKNITLQTLDAILCHNGELVMGKYEPRWNKTKEEFLSDYEKTYKDRRVSLELIPMTLEGCVVRISDLIAHKDEVLDLKSEKLELGVSSMLHDLGIPSHVRGYQYIREGVLLLYRDEEASVLVTKEIYPKIADKYQTTSSRVERAIRHAIEISWTRGDIKLMEDLFGNSIDFDRSRPTNSEFLTTLADRFKLDNKEMVF